MCILRNDKYILNIVSGIYVTITKSQRVTLMRESAFYGDLHLAIRAESFKKKTGELFICTATIWPIKLIYFT